MSLEFGHPLVLFGLGLALVPWFRWGRHAAVFSSLALLPTDRMSTLMAWAERGLTSLALCALVLGISAPYKPTATLAHIGQGAQMVVLLDRSRSMDQPFYRQNLPDVPLLARPRGESKGMVARRLLSEFAAKRREDMFGMVIFSTNPIEVLPLTQKPRVIQAAIEAGNVGHGLAETGVGAALAQAFRFFENRPYTGSRIVMLISDGAANLKLQTREQIKELATRNRVALYWLYIRTRNSPGIFEELSTTETEELFPHRSLHRFFSDMGVPYRVYTAEDPQALETAIADVSRLQNLPIHYDEIKPRQSREHWFYAAAAVCLLVLLGFRGIEIEAWT
ncbi:MAG: VWA domain-containing protein [Gammaproteobacteria bacterium]|nr:VWA domain-containing protein [Gammaproteobacteria bacterium]